MFTSNIPKNQDCSMKRCGNLTLWDAFWITLPGERGQSFSSLKLKMFFSKTIYLGCLPLYLLSVTRDCWPIPCHLSSLSTSFNLGTGYWSSLRRKLNSNSSGMGPSKFCWPQRQLFKLLKKVGLIKHELKDPSTHPQTVRTGRFRPQMTPYESS